MKEEGRGETEERRREGRRKREEDMYLMKVVDREGAGAQEMGVRISDLLDFLREMCDRGQGKMPLSVKKRLRRMRRKDRSRTREAFEIREGREMTGRETLGMRHGEAGNAGNAEDVLNEETKLEDLDQRPAHEEGREHLNSAKTSCFSLDTETGPICFSSRAELERFRRAYQDYLLFHHVKRAPAIERFARQSSWKAAAILRVMEDENERCKRA